MLPHSMANYSFFASSYTFRWLYFHCKSEIVALANWSLAAATGFVLAVCIDRLYGIKSPLYSCREWSAKKTTLVLVGICIVTAILTSHGHFAYHCYQFKLCNGTQIHATCISVAADKWYKNQTNPHSNLMRSYIRIGTIVNMLFVVIIPVFVLAALNIALVHALKQRGKELQLTSCDGIRRGSDGAVQRKQERKVAVTVCAIVCCFTLTHGPAAVMMVWNLATGFAPIKNPTLYGVGTAANSLVIVGKSSNFFLFCLSSSNFRQRLLQLIKRRAEVLSHNSTYFPKRASDTSTTLIRSPRRSLQLVSIEPIRTRASSYCAGSRTAGLRSTGLVTKIRSLDSGDL
uniref:G-protein coupled receptors family 1 profile domain-containing protein n=1 Tax=Plectus sambesii TaxID=2011161 RepID=A0A914WJC2_9BILA